MFNDLIKNKIEVLKKNLGLDLTTKLNADTIAKKVVKEHEYHTGVELEFNIIKRKGIVKMTMTHNGKVTDYILKEQDKLVFTHHFDVT